MRAVSGVSVVGSGLSVGLRPARTSTTVSRWGTNLSTKCNRVATSVDSKKYKVLAEWDGDLRVPL
jgi:hypothetical protein